MSEKYRPKKRGMIFFASLIIITSSLYMSGVISTLWFVANAEDFGQSDLAAIKLVSSLYTQSGLAAGVVVLVFLYLFKKTADIYFHQKRLIAIQMLIDSKKVGVEVATGIEVDDKNQIVNKL